MTADDSVIRNHIHCEKNAELVRLVSLVATPAALVSANVHEVHHLLSELETTQSLTTQSE